MHNDLVFKINAPQVISEVIDGEAVIVNLDTGAYYSVQGSGGYIWELIQEGASYAKMVTRLAERYGSDPADICPPLISFLSELQQEGLIETPIPLETIDSLVSKEMSRGDDNAFEGPLLQKYTDMAELLLLDPIHEVNETGWPRAETEK